MLSMARAQQLLYYNNNRTKGNQKNISHDYFEEMAQQKHNQWKDLNSNKEVNDWVEAVIAFDWTQKKKETFMKDKDDKNELLAAVAEDCEETFHPDVET